MRYDAYKMDEPSLSLVEQVIKQCRDGRFTGLLRIRAREGDGELRFLSGIRDDARFGVSTGDEALERLIRATNPKFEALPRLPGLTGGFKQRLAPEGPLGEIRPIDLFRYCETYALTCTLELESKGQRARAHYHIGELTSIDGASGEEAVAAMLDSNEGSYRFILPPFELPEGVSLSQPPPAVEPVSSELRVPRDAAPPSFAQDGVKPKAPEGAEARTGADSRAAEADLVSKLEAEARRKAEAEAEARRRQEAEARKREEEAKRAAEAEARRKAEAEARRKAEAEAEARRKAQEEAKRKAEAEAAEARRKAEAEARAKVAEAAKQKAEAEAAEARKRAEVEAEAKRKAEAEVRKKAEAALAEAEAKRKAEEEETKRKAKAEAAAAKEKAEAEARARRQAEAARRVEEPKRKTEGELPSTRAVSKRSGAAGAVREASRDSERAVAASPSGSNLKWLVLAVLIVAIVAFLLSRK